jgi:hypothetical protein
MKKPKEITIPGSKPGDPVPGEEVSFDTIVLTDLVYLEKCPQLGIEKSLALD